MKIKYFPDEKNAGGRSAWHGSTTSGKTIQKFKICKIRIVKKIIQKFDNFQNIWEKIKS